MFRSQHQSGKCRPWSMATFWMSREERHKGPKKSRTPSAGYLTSPPQSTPHGYFGAPVIHLGHTLLCLCTMHDLLAAGPGHQSAPVN